MAEDKCMSVLNQALDMVDEFELNKKKREKEATLMRVPEQMAPNFTIPVSVSPCFIIPC